MKKKNKEPEQKFKYKVYRKDIFGKVLLCSFNEYDEEYFKMIARGEHNIITEDDIDITDKFKWLLYRIYLQSYFNNTKNIYRRR